MSRTRNLEALPKTRSVSLRAEADGYIRRERPLDAWLDQVVTGLTPIRNKMSDGHNRERTPEKHHRCVIAARTVTTFIVQVCLVQRGLLSSSLKRETAR